MDSIKNTLAEMMESFNVRMTAFEADLHKNPSAPSSTTGLATEFAAYRTFIVQALGSLQQQVEVLARSVDHMEMQGRRKMLLLHGVTESQKEDTALVVVAVVKQQLKFVDFTEAQIKRCHRLGRPTSSQKARPIVIKFRDVALRDEIWFAKTKLKGSGVTLSEFLTKARHSVFMTAREKFGVSSCWTKAGAIYVLETDGTRHRITSSSDLYNIGPQVTIEPQIQPEVEPRITTVKTKRAAATKKAM